MCPLKLTIQCIRLIFIVNCSCRTTHAIPRIHGYVAPTVASSTEKPWFGARAHTSTYRYILISPLIAVEHNGAPKRQWKYRQTDTPNTPNTPQIMVGNMLMVSSAPSANKNCENQHLGSKCSNHHWCIALPRIVIVSVSDSILPVFVFFCCNQRGNRERLDAKIRCFAMHSKFPRCDRCTLAKSLDDGTRLHRPPNSLAAVPAILSLIPNSINPVQTHHHGMCCAWWSNARVDRIHIRYTRLQSISRDRSLNSQTDSTIAKLSVHALHAHLWFSFTFCCYFFFIFSSESSGSEARRNCFRWIQSFRSFSFHTTSSMRPTKY